jgi:hypothetical protein
VTKQGQKPSQELEQERARSGHVLLDVIISVIAAVMLLWLALIVALTICRPNGNLIRKRCAFYLIFFAC